MLDFYNAYKEKNTSIYFISILKINWYKVFYQPSFLVLSGDDLGDDVGVSLLV